MDVLRTARNQCPRRVRDLLSRRYPVEREPIGFTFQKVNGLKNKHQHLLPEDFPVDLSGMGWQPLDHYHAATV